MFRRGAFVCALALCFSAVAAQGVAFDGRDYQLAQVEVKDLEVVNRYLPSGKQQERWEPSLSIRAFKGKSSTDEVVAAYIERIRPTLVDAPITMKRDHSADDAVLILFRKTSETNVVEYELERFSRAKEGVVSYRFTQRMPADADVTAVLSRQPQRIEQLFNMSVPVKDAM